MTAIALVLATYCALVWLRRRVERRQRDVWLWTGDGFVRVDSEWRHVTIRQRPYDWQREP